MSEQQLAVLRGGGPRDGLVWPVTADLNQLWFMKGDSSGSSGVYARTDQVEKLPEGLAVVFVYLGLTVDET